MPFSSVPEFPASLTLQPVTYSGTKRDERRFTWRGVLGAFFLSGDFLLTTDKNWTVNQLKFIYWLATPEDIRNPKTQADFAKDIGVTEVTVSRWKAKPELTAEVNRMARAELGKDLPAVYGTLRKLAIKGSFQHMKLYLELLEEYREEVDVNITDERQIIRDEIDELAKRRAARLAG